MRKLVKERVVPFSKVDKIIRQTLEKQYPGVKFRVVKFRMWQEGNCHTQEILGVE